MTIETKFWHRVLAAPVSAKEIRVFAYIVLFWFLMDFVWFISTLFHWFGL